MWQLHPWEITGLGTVFETSRDLLVLLLVRLCACYALENCEALVKPETYGRINICIACNSHRNKTVLAIKVQESILKLLWPTYLRIPSVCSVTATRLLTAGSGLFPESSLHTVWIGNSVKALQLSIERLHILLRGRFTFLTLPTVDVFALIVFADKPGELCG